MDAEADWAHMLSLGEQQRVAWLRLLLHVPALAFLDEVTALPKRCISISISIMQISAQRVAWLRLLLHAPAHAFLD